MSRVLSTEEYKKIENKRGILRISAKCSDLCWTEYTDSKGNKTESNGYVPEQIGIGDGGGTMNEPRGSKKTRPEGITRNQPSAFSE